MKITMPDVHPDQKYLDALLTNDTILIKEIYRKYADKIKWMVLQNQGQEEDAKDIFSEAIMALFSMAKNKDFKLTCPFEAVFFLICKRKWLNELSKKKNRPIIFTEIDGFDNIGEDSIKAAEDCLMQENQQKLFDEKFNELDHKCKEILQLSWRTKSMPDVASALNLSYGYARKKKSECIAELVKLISQSSV